MFEGEDGVDRRVRAKSLLKWRLPCCTIQLQAVYLLIAICVALIAGKGDKVWGENGLFFLETSDTASLNDMFNESGSSARDVKSVLTEIEIPAGLDQNFVTCPVEYIFILDFSGNINDLERQRYRELILNVSVELGLDGEPGDAISLITSFSGGVGPDSVNFNLTQLSTVKEFEDGLNQAFNGFDDEAQGSDVAAALVQLANYTISRNYSDGRKLIPVLFIHDALIDFSTCELQSYVPDPFSNTDSIFCADMAMADVLLEGEVNIQSADDYENLCSSLSRSEALSDRLPFALYFPVEKERDDPFGIEPLHFRYFKECSAYNDSISVFESRSGEFTLDFYSSEQGFNETGSFLARAFQQIPCVVSGSPSAAPTTSPSQLPTTTPTTSPSTSPSLGPTESPSTSPSTSPTRSPTGSPSLSPSVSPTTSEPTESPSLVPSVSPSLGPTKSPTASPTTSNPTVSPSFAPSLSPSIAPSRSPSFSPTTSEPTVSPTTSSPSVSPSFRPSESPTNEPTACLSLDEGDVIWYVVGMGIFLIIFAASIGYHLRSSGCNTCTTTRSEGMRPADNVIHSCGLAAVGLCLVLTIVVITLYCTSQRKRYCATFERQETSVCGHHNNPWVTSSLVWVFAQLGLLYRACEMEVHTRTADMKSRAGSHIYDFRDQAADTWAIALDTFVYLLASYVLFFCHYPVPDYQLCSSLLENWAFGFAGMLGMLLYIGVGFTNPFAYIKHPFHKEWDSQTEVNSCSPKASDIFKMLLWLQVVKIAVIALMGVVILSLVLLGVTFLIASVYWFIDWLRQRGGQHTGSLSKELGLRYPTFTVCGLAAAIGAIVHADYDPSIDLESHDTGTSLAISAILVIICLVGFLRTGRSWTTTMSESSDTFVPTRYLQPYFIGGFALMSIITLPTWLIVHLFPYERCEVDVIATILVIEQISFFPEAFLECAEVFYDSKFDSYTEYSKRVWRLVTDSVDALRSFPLQEQRKAGTKDESSGSNPDDEKLDSFETARTILTSTVPTIKFIVKATGVCVGLYHLISKLNAEEDELKKALVAGATTTALFLGILGVWSKNYLRDKDFWLNARDPENEPNSNEATQGYSRI